MKKLLFILFSFLSVSFSFGQGAGGGVPTQFGIGQITSTNGTISISPTNGRGASVDLELGAGLTNIVTLNGFSGAITISATNIPSSSNWVAVVSYGNNIIVSNQFSSTNQLYQFVTNFQAAIINYVNAAVANFALLQWGSVNLTNLSRYLLMDVFGNITNTTLFITNGSLSTSYGATGITNVGGGSYPVYIKTQLGLFKFGELGQFYAPSIALANSNIISDISGNLNISGILTLSNSTGYQLWLTLQSGKEHMHFENIGTDDYLAGKSTNYINGATVFTVEGGADGEFLTTMIHHPWTVQSGAYSMTMYDHFAVYNGSGNVSWSLPGSLKNSAYAGAGIPPWVNTNSIMVSNTYDCLIINDGTGVINLSDTNSDPIIINGVTQTISSTNAVNLPAKSYVHFISDGTNLIGTASSALYAGANVTFTSQGLSNIINASGSGGASFTFNNSQFMGTSVTNIGPNAPVTNINPYGMNIVSNVSVTNGQLTITNGPFVITLTNGIFITNGTAYLIMQPTSIQLSGSLNVNGITNYGAFVSTNNLLATNYQAATGIQLNTNGTITANGIEYTNALNNSMISTVISASNGAVNTSESFTSTASNALIKNFDGEFGTNSNTGQITTTNSINLTNGSASATLNLVSASGSGSHLDFFTSNLKTWGFDVQGAGQHILNIINGYTGDTVEQYLTNDTLEINSNELVNGYITNATLSPSALVMAGGGTNLQSVITLVGLSLSGTTLTVTGSGGGNNFTNVSFTTNNGIIEPTNLVWNQSGAWLSNGGIHSDLQTPGFLVNSEGNGIFNCVSLNVTNINTGEGSVLFNNGIEVADGFADNPIMLVDAGVLSRFNGGALSTGFTNSGSFSNNGTVYLNGNVIATNAFISISNGNVYVSFDTNGLRFTNGTVTTTVNYSAISSSGTYLINSSQFQPGGTIVAGGSITGGSFSTSGAATFANTSGFDSSGNLSVNGGVAVNGSESLSNNSGNVSLSFYPQSSGGVGTISCAPGGVTVSGAMSFNLNATPFSLGNTAWAVYKSFNQGWLSITPAGNTIVYSNLGVNGFATIGSTIQTGVGGTAPTSVSVGGSPFTFNCPSGKNVTVYISGGALASGVTLNGTTITGTVSTGVLTINMSPGDAIVVSYTVLPTMYYRSL
jgi:hypothetical protein